jgi:hypothetical protein
MFLFLIHIQVHMDGKSDEYKDLRSLSDECRQLANDLHITMTEMRSCMDKLISSQTRDSLFWKYTAYVDMACEGLVFFVKEKMPDVDISDWRTFYFFLLRERDDALDRIGVKRISYILWDDLSHRSILLQTGEMHALMKDYYEHELGMTDAQWAIVLEYWGERNVTEYTTRCKSFQDRALDLKNDIDGLPDAAKYIGTEVAEALLPILKNLLKSYSGLTSLATCSVD